MEIGRVPKVRVVFFFFWRRYGQTDLIFVNGIRFATELAGRKAQRHTWNGLYGEMARAGWFDAT